MGAGRTSIVALVLAAGLTPTPRAGADTQHPPLKPPGALLAPLTRADSDDTLEIGGEDINGRKFHTRMTVPVQVNGTGPHHFIVDSGADTSVIGARIARALTLRPGGRATLFGMTASGPVERVVVDDLSLGQSRFADLTLPVLEERFVGGAGMIGIDALVEQRLMLDFEKRVIKVEDAKRPAPRLDGEIVVIARRRRGQLILTQARANGKPVDAVIDTGSEITIGNTALRDRVMRRFPGKFETAEVTGVTGVTVRLQMARVAELRLGPVILQDVPVAFADVPPFAAFGLSDAPALLLGTDLMEVFRRVSLDFRHRKVRFQLRRCAPVGVTLSTAGVNDKSRVSLANGAMVACRR
jgi:predicted aspartyl protease